jgi:hypothetical protein
MATKLQWELLRLSIIFYYYTYFSVRVPDSIKSHRVCQKRYAGFQLLR